MLHVVGLFHFDVGRDEIAATQDPRVLLNGADLVIHGDFTLNAKLLGVLLECLACMH